MGSVHEFEESELEELLEQATEEWIAPIYEGVVRPSDITDTIARIRSLNERVQENGSLDERRELAMYAEELEIHAATISDYLHIRERRLLGKRNEIVREKAVDEYFFVEEAHEHLLKVIKVFDEYYFLARRIDELLVVPRETVHVGGEEYLNFKQPVSISARTRKAIGEDSFEAIRWYAGKVRHFIEEGFRSYRLASAETANCNEAWKRDPEVVAEMSEQLANAAAHIVANSHKLSVELVLIGSVLDRARLSNKVTFRRGKKLILSEMRTLYESGKELIERGMYARIDFANARDDLTDTGWQP